MANLTFEAYVGAPGWTNIGSNRLVFCASLTDLTSRIAALAFQDGTHLGSSTPGTDQCGATHAPNVKWLTDSTFSYNGGGSTALNDTNLLDTYCTMRIHLNDSTAFKTQNGRFYAFNNTTTTVQATGVEMAAYEKGNSSTWFHLNDDTTTGPSGWTTGSIGGDNSGERITMAARGSAATDQYYYYALSLSPETFGDKSSVAVGCSIELF